jgi:hypothetical protein
MMIAHTINIDGQPFDLRSLLPSLYLYLGSLMVIVKHRTNILRLFAGTENHLSPSRSRERFALGIHLLALGWLFGATFFLQFIAGLSVFETFPEVVAQAPSDRTAQIAIADGLSDDQKKQLGSALAGAAVAPMFPKYFVWSALAVVVATISASGWRKRSRLDACRFWLLVLCTILILTDWWIADEVSRLRLERFSSNPSIADKAKAAFGSWHLVSLFTNLIAGLFSGIALFLAGSIRGECQESAIILD